MTYVTSRYPQNKPMYFFPFSKQEKQLKKLYDIPETDDLLYATYIFSDMQLYAITSKRKHNNRNMFKEPCTCHMGHIA